MITRLGRQSLIRAELHFTASSKVVYANPPDEPEMSVWRSRLKDGDLFVDVGANVGVYAIYAAELGAEVVALEPSPEMATKLRENLSLNGISATIHEVAASASSGYTQFVGGDVWGHLVPGDTVDPNVAVRTERLDDLIGDAFVDGLKIDVEGAERLVLDGATRLLREQRVRCIQLEWNECSLDVLGESREPIVELLSSFGYEIKRPDSNGSLTTPADATFGSDVFAVPATSNA